MGFVTESGATFELALRPGRGFSQAERKPDISAVLVWWWNAVRPGSKKIKVKIVGVGGTIASTLTERLNSGYGRIRSN